MAKQDFKKCKLMIQTWHHHHHHNNNIITFELDPEVLAGEGLAKLPISRDNVPRGGSAPVTAGNPEGQ